MEPSGSAAPSGPEADTVRPMDPTLSESGAQRDGVAAREQPSYAALELICRANHAANQAAAGSASPVARPVCAFAGAHAGAGEPSGRAERLVMAAGIRGDHLSILLV